MDLEVRHLKLVSAVAEHQNLTKAGSALNLSQSALSHQLLDVEDRLGARLFHRLSRRMVPTPAGERLIEAAKIVLTELTAAETAIRSGDGLRPVLLRLAIECYTGYHWLPSVLKPFRRRYPHVEVRIDPGATNDPLTRLLDGRLELAIVSSAVKSPRLAVKPLFEDEQVLLVPASHPLASRPFARLSDFRGERLLAYAEGDDNHFVTRILRPAGVLPGSLEVVKLTEAAIEMVRAGLGIAVLSRWVVEPSLRRGSLAAVRITPHGHFKHWGAVVQPHLVDADYVRDFIDLIAEHAPCRRDTLVPARRRTAVNRPRRPAHFASPA